MLAPEIADQVSANAKEQAKDHAGWGAPRDNESLRPRRAADRAPAKTIPEGADPAYPPEFFQCDPAVGAFTVAHSQMTSPIELHFKCRPGATTEFETARGMKVVVRTSTAEDRVLVVGNVPTSTTMNHAGVCWALKRGDLQLGPQFVTWTRALCLTENVLLPWVDAPGKARLDVEYSCGARLKGTVSVSRQNERRQLTALVIPGGQVTTAGSREAQSVEPGQWHDVVGLQQISVTNEGEKVLVICSIIYMALWGDEETRGRFTILRDGIPLDFESYGLQSVRSLQKGLKRTLVMSLVDDPEPGAHLYTVRAAVTTEGDEPRVMVLDDEDRQLSLIRLPGSAVSGPLRCEGPATIDEDHWTEVPGLSAEVAVKRASEKVLVVYHINFNPTCVHYEVYFTLFRRSQSSPAGPRNLGHESTGMWSVASDYAASSEYPAAMFVDVPGVGTHTYSLHVRTRRCDHLLEAPAVEVGPDGQLAAVLLEVAR